MKKIKLKQNDQGRGLICTKCKKSWWVWWDSYVNSKGFVCNKCQGITPSCSSKSSIHHDSSPPPSSFVHNTCMQVSTMF